MNNIYCVHSKHQKLNQKLREITAQDDLHFSYKTLGTNQYVDGPIFSFAAVVYSVCPPAKDIVKEIQDFSRHFNQTFKKEINNLQLWLS